MTTLNDLLASNKLCVFNQYQRLSEPVIYRNQECYTLTDYIFYAHSIRDTEIEIQSHLNGEKFELKVNLDIQRLKYGQITDIEAKSATLNINQAPSQLLDEISHQVAAFYTCDQVGQLLNVLEDYALYIDMLYDLNIENYDGTTELLFIEHDLPVQKGLHYLKLNHNQLKSINDAIIDFSWFIDVIGIQHNELKKLENINIGMI